MANLPRLVLILGSTREGRFCDKVAQWVINQLEADGAYEVDIVDPANLALPPRIEAEDGHAVKGLASRIAAADAFLVITPEYNHGYPGALKNLIDSAYREWNAKPVGFISYGGQAGGSRAVEQLRQVFAELHAVTMRDTMTLANPWADLDQAGQLSPPEGALRGWQAMLEQLGWWTAALVVARKRQAYQAEAA